MNQRDAPICSLVGGVFALGNFDGVHKGHQALIQAACAIARRQNVPAQLLSFEPHPRSILKPEAPPFRLTPRDVKEGLIRDLGIDNVETLDFTRAFSRLSAADFVEKILVQHLRATHVVAGFDFVFGHQRGGTLADLRAMLIPHKVEVTEVAPLRDAKGVIISSTRIRQLLAAGDLAGVLPLLGRPWSMTGTVIQGAQRGRTLDFPTANVDLRDYQRPRFGVYAIMARRRGDTTYFPGVANIGIRPTVDEGRELLEFHLFNLHADMYGQTWDVELHHFLRPERAFDSLSALREQIVADVLRARSLLSCPVGRMQ